MKTENLGEDDAFLWKAAISVAKMAIRAGKRRDVYEAYDQLDRLIFVIKLIRNKRAYNRLAVFVDALERNIKRKVGQQSAPESVFY